METHCLLADVYAYFQQGLYFDEDGQKNGALEMYEKGMELFDKAVADSKTAAEQHELYEGLAATKVRVEPRIAELKKRDKSTPADGKDVDDIRQALRTNRVDDAELIYWLPEGVQLTVIENGTTCAPTPPSAMAILKLEEKEKFANDTAATAPIRPAAIIQVGPWIYSLFPGRTAILKNELGVYIVPNPSEQSPDMFVGIMLPRGIEPRLEEEFVYALNQYAVVQTSAVVSEMTPEERRRTSERIAEFFIRSGDSFAQTVNRAASRTGEFIVDHGSKYRAGMAPREGTPFNINPIVRHSVFILHKGSKLVAKVTKQLLNKIGEVGESIGRSVAGSVNTESSGSRFVRGTFTVVGGGITGASTVWMALEDASKTLFRNFADETVRTINVKYGDQASETARHALYAAGHTALASFQLYELGPRSIAGHMARRAGLQFVRDYNLPSSSSRDSAAGGSAPPKKQ